MSEVEGLGGMSKLGISVCLVQPSQQVFTSEACRVAVISPAIVSHLWDALLLRLPRPPASLDPIPDFSIVSTGMETL